MARGGVVIPLLTEFKPQGIDKAIREFEKLDSKTKKVGFALEKAFLPAVAVVGAMAAGFVKMSRAGEEAATSNARIATIAESMGLFGDRVGAVTSRLIDMSEELARNTGVNQNNIKQVEATLLTFGEVAQTADTVGGAFDRATVAALDLAAAGFGTAESNAIQLGKALNDPVKGISALSRAGVTFTQEEKERIKVLVKSNEIGEAQALVLEAIEKQVGGTAKATANASDIMAVSFSQMQEKIGLALLPAFEKLTGFASAFFDVIANNQTTFLIVAGAVGALAGAIVLANIAMKAFAGMQTIVKIANTVMGTSFDLTAAKAAKFVGGLGAVGIAIGLGTVAYSLYKREKERLAEITDTFTAALRAEAEGQDGATNAAIGSLLATEKMQERLEKLGLTNSDLAKAIKGEASPAFDEFAEKMAFVNEKGISAQESQRRLGEAFGDAGGNARAVMSEVDRLSKSYQEAQAQIDLTESVTRELEAAQTDLAKQFIYADDTSLAMADSIWAANDAMARYEKQVRAADDALNKLIDSSLAMFNADLALLNQIDSTTDTVEKYAKMLGEGKASARELERAQRDVVSQALSQAEAAVKAAEAQKELAGETLTGSERQKIMVDNLSEVARALAPGDPLRRQLAGYIEQLGAVPRDVITRFTTVRTEIVETSRIEAQQFSPAAIAAASAPRQSRNIGGPVFGVPGTSVPITAHGGEYVLSADVVDAIKRGAPSRGLGRGGAPGGAGGNVINITVTSADPQAVVDAIRRYNRTNGPAPIKVLV